MGPFLTEFKALCAEGKFDSVQMGYAIAHHPELKRIHNSFARNPDLPYLVYPNIPIEMPEEEEDEVKRTPKKQKKMPTFEEEVPFHFVAYVPVNGTIYEMDGQRLQPKVVGEYSDREQWWKDLFPLLQERMMAYGENEVNFSLLACMLDPLRVEAVHAKSNEAKEAVAEKQAAQEQQLQDINTRRTHNYAPFFKEFIRLLHEKQLLDDSIA